MNWLIIPILFWLIAVLILMLPKILERKIQKVKAELLINAESAKKSNPVESNYKKMEENVLDTFTINNLSLMSSISGSILIALGTFILCLVLLL